MNPDNLIITVVASDRPGIVQRLSDTILAHNGNWLESRLSRLCGQFAGIVHVAVVHERQDDLLESLQALADEGIQITVQHVQADAEIVDMETAISISVEANDRPGIVEEISSALARADVNVVQIDTACESASMAGYALFKAQLLVTLPEEFTVEQLEAALENVSDDLMTSISA